jgi:hypothetical protein
MWQFIRGVLAFTAFQGLLLGGFLWHFYDVEWTFPIYAATRIKHERLEAAVPPRLILVGGSNLLFGIESEQIEARTGYNPVNMGLIAGLRLEYMLREAETAVTEGDLVVLGLEYHHFNAEADAAHAQVLMRVIWTEPANVRHLSPAHWRLLLDKGAFQEFGISFRHAWRNMRSGRRQRPKLPINAYGDLTVHHQARKRPTGVRQPTIPYRLNVKRVEANLQRLNLFNERCRERGATVVYTFPPVPDIHFEAQEKVARAFHERLVASAEVPVITTQRAMVFPADQFINESYHLYGATVAERTDRLVDAVLQYLASEPERWQQPGFDDVVPARE